MSGKDYLKDRFAILVSWIAGVLFVLWMIQVYGGNWELTLAIGLVLGLSLVIGMGYDYFHRRRFYHDFTGKLDSLQEKYLITELIETPSFFEGRFLCDSLYDIDKAMQEHIMDYRHRLDDFRVYLEMWIHEVKLPISALYLMLHNHPSELNTRIRHQVERIDRCTEQVLYYMRANHSEKDYLISRHSLKEVVYAAISKHRDQFREGKVALEIKNLEGEVYTDSKWLVFILSQIIQNAFQYTRGEDDCIIFDSRREKDCLILSIEDHGCGISASDLKRVFEPSFTGSNGRRQSKSTGMGLYLCHNLCRKLGHRLTIDSKEQAWTRVEITFRLNDYYDVV